MNTPPTVSTPELLPSRKEFLIKSAILSALLGVVIGCLLGGLNHSASTGCLAGGLTAGIVFILFGLLRWHKEYSFSLYNMTFIEKIIYYFRPRHFQPLEEMDSSKSGEGEMTRSSSSSSAVSVDFTTTDDGP
jgi:hypothetical protein